MMTSSPSNRRTALLAALAFVTIAAAGFMLGCKSTQPKPATTEQQPVTRPPVVNKDLYSATADAKADIAAALTQASRENKRVILDFGGNWCGDCQVLDIYFHQSPNDDLLTKNFVVVHVDIGHMDKNVDVADKYGIPLKKGVPALAVLDARGEVLYSQKTGEFENMRNMSADSVTTFLNQWKA